MSSIPRNDEKNQGICQVHSSRELPALAALLIQYRLQPTPWRFPGFAHRKRMQKRTDINTFSLRLMACRAWR